MLDELKRIDKSRLEILRPANFTGDSRTNELMINKINQEKVIGELQLMGIQKPEKLSVLRFHIIIFNLEKKNKPKGHEK